MPRPLLPLLHLLPPPQLLLGLSTPLRQVTSIGLILKLIPLNGKGQLEYNFNFYLKNDFAYYTIYTIACYLLLIIIILLF
jgi:hypothetical protein